MPALQVLGNTSLRGKRKVDRRAGGQQEGKVVDSEERKRGNDTRHRWWKMVDERCRRGERTGYKWGAGSG